MSWKVRDYVMEGDHDKIWTQHKQPSDKKYNKNMRIIHHATERVKCTPFYIPPLETAGYKWPPCFRSLWTATILGCVSLAVKETLTN